MTSLLKLLRRRTDDSEDGRWTAALRSAKTTSTALALWTFLLAFTLDDLHLVRFPLLYVGLGLAVVAYAFAPPLLAARALARLHVDKPDAIRASLETRAIRARVALGVTVAAFVAWLSLFASGRTPRW